MENQEVIVYTMNDCIECEMVKKVLKEEGIEFVGRNLSLNPHYQTEVENHGFLGVPVTVAGDFVVKGFTNELKELIKFVKNAD